jgi:hypothetical protein
MSGRRIPWLSVARAKQGRLKTRHEDSLEASQTPGVRKPVQFSSELLGVVTSPDVSNNLMLRKLDLAEPASFAQAVRARCTVVVGAHGWTITRVRSVHAKYAATMLERTMPSKVPAPPMLAMPTAVLRTSLPASGLARSMTTEDHLQERLRAHVWRLARDIGERNLFRPRALEAAASYLEREWREQDYAVETLAYEVSSVRCVNLEVTRRGGKRRGEI